MKRPDIEYSLNELREGITPTFDDVCMMAYWVQDLEAENAKLKTANAAHSNVLGQVILGTVVTGQSIYKTEVINQELGEHSIG